jgi:hypothetical protein
VSWVDFLCRGSGSTGRHLNNVYLNQLTVTQFFRVVIGGIVNLVVHAVKGHDRTMKRSMTRKLLAESSTHKKWRSTCPTISCIAIFSTSAAAILDPRSVSTVFYDATFSPPLWNPRHHELQLAAACLQQAWGRSSLEASSMAYITTKTARLGPKLAHLQLLAAVVRKVSLKK